MSRQERGGWFAHYQRRSRRCNRSTSFVSSYSARKLCIEQLEDRQLLAILSVDNLNDLGEHSLRQAILDANSNGEADTISFSVAGTIGIASQLPTITGDLVINGGGQIAIDAGNGTDNEFSTGDGYRIFNIDDGDANVQIEVSLNGLKLVGGDASEDGGAVRSLERLTATNLDVSQNASTGYGGGFFSSGDFVLSASSVTGNYAENRGGGVAGNSTFMDIRDSTISGNSGLGGGGVFNQYRPTFIENSSIVGNTARNIGGGGIRAYRGFLNVLNSTIDQNSAPYGAGIRSNLGNLTITGSTVNNNIGTSNIGSGRGGGGIFVRFGNFTLNESEVSGNTSRIRGGGIFTESATTQIVDSFLINNYTDDKGGGIYSEQSNLSIERSTIAFNTAQESGGGIRRIFEPDMSPLFVIDSQIFGNTTEGIGGGIAATRSVEISGSTIAENFAGTAGGGVSSAEITVESSAITGNVAGNRGGGINGFSSVTITDSTVSENTTFDIGGGIYARTLQMSRTTVSGNIAKKEGGGIASEEGPLVIADSRITGNTADKGGGGVYGSSSLSVSKSEISGNSSGDDGGGIRFQNGDLTIDQTVFSQNIASNHGGAVSSRNSDTIVTDSVVRRNTAGGDGGGVNARYGTGDLELTGTVIDGNTASGQGGGLFANVYVTTINFSTITGNSSLVEGGGIFSNRTILLKSSNVSNNSAEDRGGGWYHSISQNKTMTVISSTISGNESNENGAGLYVWSKQPDADITLAHSTVVENRSLGAGGGVFFSTGTMKIDHSILAKNEAALASDLTGLVGVNFDMHYSLIGDGTLSGLVEAPVGSPDANGNLIGGAVNGLIDPLLAEPAQNGGAGQTYNFLPGSPASDAGDPAAVAGVGSLPLHDGRGFFSRVANGRIDIGALEKQSLTPMNLVVDTLNDSINGNYDVGISRYAKRQVWQTAASVL